MHPWMVMDHRMTVIGVYRACGQKANTKTIYSYGKIKDIGAWLLDLVILVITIAIMELSYNVTCRWLVIVRCLRGGPWWELFRRPQRLDPFLLYSWQMDLSLLFRACCWAILVGVSRVVVLTFFRSRQKLQVVKEIAQSKHRSPHKISIF